MPEGLLKPQLGHWVDIGYRYSEYTYFINYIEKYQLTMNLNTIIIQRALPRQTLLGQNLVGHTHLTVLYVRNIRNPQLPRKSAVCADLAVK